MNNSEIDTQVPNLNKIFNSIGTPEYWTLYDEFCLPENLQKLVSGQEFPLLKKIHEINIIAHKNRAIHDLKRPERGWRYVMCWLTLKTEMIMNDEGRYYTLMRAGDVIVVEHGWDRDVVITHTPINGNRVCGYFLSGRWEPMIGLFLPLFDKQTILKCIELRINKNLHEAKELAEKEALDWRWFENKQAKATNSVT